MRHTVTPCGTGRASASAAPWGVRVFLWVPEVAALASPFLVGLTRTMVLRAVLRTEDTRPKPGAPTSCVAAR